MKSSLIYLKNHLVCFGAFVLLVLSVSSAKAQILLTIDDSNLSAVTITATGNFATLPGMATSTSALINDGIDLLNFLPGNITIPMTGIMVTSSTLTSGNLTGTGTVYDHWAPDDIDSPGAPDLTLYSSDPTSMETFTTTSVAFTGTLTLDLTGETLPMAGSTGTIVAGFSGDSSHPAIGQWKIEATSAPEPSSWILLFGSFAGVALWRSRLRVLRSPAKSAK